MTSGGLAAVSSSAFAALYSAFGKYDVVHIHAEGPAFFAWLPKMFGKRVVVTVHGIDWQREKWQSGLGSKFIHQGEKNAAKYADEVIVLSKGVQDYFKETYGRETHFIPNGVNRPQIREAKLITDHFGLEKDSYILFLGRLVPEKIGTVDKTTGKTVKVDLDRQLLKPLAGTGKMFCYDSPEYVKDMGTPDRFHQVEEDFKAGRVSAKNLSNKQKAVFLDRDGTINKYVGFLRNINDFELIDGVAEAMQQSQGMEALQMLIGGFVIFMIPQVVGSVIVLLELAAVMLRQAWYI